MNKKARGISVLEILFSVAILGILGSVSVSVFSGLSNSASFDRDVAAVASYIEKAHSMSLNSVDSLVHGVKFETHKITVYKTTTFSTQNTEAYYDLPNRTVVEEVNLTGGATQLYFDKLTGAPNVTGTLTLKDERSEQTKNITIYATGVVDIQ